MKKVFFGWYIAAASLVFAAYNSSMFVYGFTAFMIPIAATFGWGYAQVSIALSIRQLETGALEPLVGAAADRWPARKLMLIGIVIFAAGIFWTSQATSLALFYAGFLISGLGAAFSIHIVPTTVIARWFKKNIGKVSGISAAGIALGGLFTPQLVKMIDTYGWQTTLVYLSGGAVILGVPLSLLFRNRPQDYGLLPDGKPQDEAKVPGTADFSLGVKEALKTRAFWYIGIATAFQITAMQAVAINLMPYLESLGLARARAAVAVRYLSLVSLGARIPFGALADIFTKKYVMALSLGLITVGQVILRLMDGSSFALVVLFTVIHGLGAAGAGPLRTPMVREYFGIRKFGTIFGLMNIFFTVGMAAGPPLAGWVFDTRGTYQLIWVVYSGLNLLGMVLILFLPLPYRKTTPMVA